MRTSLAGSLAAAATLLAAGAHALPTFSVSGGNLFDDTTNDFLWIDSPVTEGGFLELSEPAVLTIEYIGKEAGFPATELWFGASTAPGGTLVATTNSGFPVTEGSLSATPFPPPGIARGAAPLVTQADAGVLPFYFRVPGNENAIVPNGGGAEGDIAFWWKTASGALENVVYVLLDDSGGFNPGEPSDNDHDDMIVRITASPIPEPGTGALLVIGLAGCAVSRRSGRFLCGGEGQR